jgi:hypothetical protein
MDPVFAAEHLGLIARAKLDHISACLALGKDPAEDVVMAKPDAGFGQNVGKLQRMIQGKLKDLRYEILMMRAKAELPKDDQRRISLEAAEFPANLDASIKLENNEFTTSFQRKLGLPLSCLWLHVGEPIATNGKSRRLRVDPFGSNVAAAPGVSGDQARMTHDAFTTRVVRLIKEAGIPASGGGYGSVKGVFSKTSTRATSLLRTKTRSTASSPTQKSTAVQPCGSPIARPTNFTML